MNYNEAVNYINDISKYGSAKGLDSIGRLLNAIGNPHERLNFIHIAGTNGKGSNASYIANMLVSGKYVVGSFVSPYLERMNERFQINLNPMYDENLIKYTEIIKKACDDIVYDGFPHPTSFEIVTAMGMLYFDDENCDFVVLEVGIGGRNDCTNIIPKSVASVITTIGLDHMDILGNTLPEIASEKAGIIKKDGLVFSFKHNDEVDDVIIKEAESNNADLIFVQNDNVLVKHIDGLGTKFNYSYGDETIEDIEINLIGYHQVNNASLSLTVILELRSRGIVNISNADILKGLYNTRWAGRLEVLQRNPAFVIDGAHNIEGIEALNKSIDLFEYDKLILGLSILHDKEYEKMIEKISSKADVVIITEIDYSRKTTAEELVEVVKKYNQNYIVEKHMEDAVNKALEIANDNDLIVFAGSLYLIGDIRTYFKKTV
ncbi:MAG: bifunctional folylpolyglutamate synthase/dihydrofolate synthase [Tissierellia bacterium]|nr:bifunctional folylpolyglutamate synthase/dihydrofolate synthase [Tissierellia bacterium]